METEGSVEEVERRKRYEYRRENGSMEVEIVEVGELGG